MNSDDQITPVPTNVEVLAPEAAQHYVIDARFQTVMSTQTADNMIRVADGQADARIRVIEAEARRALAETNAHADAEERIRLADAKVESEKAAPAKWASAMSTLKVAIAIGGIIWLCSHTNLDPTLKAGGSLVLALIAFAEPIIKMFKKG